MFWPWASYQGSLHFFHLNMAVLSPTSVGLWWCHEVFYNAVNMRLTHNKDHCPARLFKSSKDTPFYPLPEKPSFPSLQESSPNWRVTQCSLPLSYQKSRMLAKYSSITPLYNLQSFLSFPITHGLITCVIYKWIISKSLPFVSFPTLNHLKLLFIKVKSI